MGTDLFCFTHFDVESSILILMSRLSYCWQAEVTCWMTSVTIVINIFVAFLFKSWLFAIYLVIVWHLYREVPCCYLACWLLILQQRLLANLWLEVSYDLRLRGLNRLLQLYGPVLWELLKLRNLDPAQIERRHHHLLFHSVYRGYMEAGDQIFLVASPKHALQIISVFD